MHRIWGCEAVRNVRMVCAHSFTDFALCWHELQSDVHRRADPKVMMESCEADIQNGLFRKSFVDGASAVAAM